MTTRSFIPQLMTTAACLLAVVAACPAAAQSDAGDDQAPPPPNFDDHIVPIINEYCLFCHRGDRAKNGFRLDNYAAMMQGGSSGPAIEPGNSGGSLLYLLVAHDREPTMPPDEPRIADDKIATIREWIDAGAPENAGAASKAAAAAKAEAQAVTVIAPELNTPAQLPTGLPTDPYWWTQSPGTIRAIAASPTTPVVAIAGHRQILLYHTQTLELLGVLDHPHGDIETLRFIGNGKTLLAAGGIGATSGDVILFDVATGNVIVRTGGEIDVVLAADVPPDHLLIAHGGPAGVVTVRALEDQRVLYTLDEAHTDWITAIAFSPDGALLATGDRAGNIFVWESLTGREFHKLTAHQGAITGLAWRGDGLYLASAGEDAAVRLHDMNNGRQARNWNARSPVTALDWHHTGTLMTTGRDGRARTWNNQGQPVRESPPMTDLATAGAISHDGARVIAGDLAGTVRVFEASDGHVAGDLAMVLPPPALVAMEDAARTVAQLESRSAQLAERSSAAEQSLAAAQQALAQADAALNEAVAKAQAAQTLVEQHTAAAERTLQQLAPFETAATQATQQRATVEQQLAAARAEADAAAQEMTTALDALLAARAKLLGASDDATRQQLQQEVDRLSRQHDGAAALATLALQRVAELEIAQTRLAREATHWTNTAAPIRQTLTQQREQLTAAQQSHAALASQVGAAQTTRDQAQQAVEASTTVRDAANAEIAQLAQQIADAKTRAAAATDLWNTRRAEIIAARGRVAPRGD